MGNDELVTLLTVVHAEVIAGVVAHLGPTRGFARPR